MIDCQKRYGKLPDLVITLLVNHQGWLVGTGAAWLVEDTDELPSDFDVIIPPTEWCEAMRVIHHATDSLVVRFNKFGGLKVLGKYSGLKGDIDVWPSTLEDFLPGDRDQVAIRLSPRTIVRATTI